ncbi:hypothetical protein FA95DRAFT_1578167, partial [Auriscalpium vulgare]
TEEHEPELDLPAGPVPQDESNTIAKTMLQSASFLDDEPVETPLCEDGAAAVEVEFITVDPSPENLCEHVYDSSGTGSSLDSTEVFRSDFPDIAGARPLLEAIRSSALPGEEGNPSADVIAFVERVENADPNAPDLKDEDLNANWGHRQFTAGKLTWSGVLTKWENVGTVDMSCRLLAASVRDCQVPGICASSEKSRLSRSWVMSTFPTSWRPLCDAGQTLTRSMIPSQGNPATADVENAAPLTDEELRTLWSKLTKEELKT